MGLDQMIEVYINGAQVAYDNVNYTKSTQRKSVAGDAYSDGDLDVVAKFYPRKHMHKDLAIFASKASFVFSRIRALRESFFKILSKKARPDGLKIKK